ncbi:unnamed protein product [Rhodiola kirilowii]
MSILGRNRSSSSSSSSMGTPGFRELKKQASFFFKEKIKTARLALTDVTPAQLMTEEITSGNQWGPDTQTMRMIAKAAFEVDDYWRIVDILHKRLSKFDEQNWRVSYNSLILLEHLLTQGPVSAADEFLIDQDAISEMESFQYIDDKGFNWGLAVRKKSERVLSLLENRPLLKQERDRYRKITRGIQGFGSFGERTPDHSILKQSSSFGAFGMSDYLHRDAENNNSFVEDNGHATQQRQEETDSFSFRKVQLHGNWITETRHKENTAPGCLDLPITFKSLNFTGESRPLLDENKDKPDSGISTNEDHHPFSHAEAQASESLLTTKY